MSQVSSPPELREEGSVGPLGFGVVPDVLFAPGRAGARLAGQPRWVGPFLVTLLLTALGAWISLPVTLEFSYEAAQRAMDKMGVPAADQAEALARMPDSTDRSAPVLLQHVGGGVFVIAALGFLGTAVLHAIARLAGRLPTFRQTLALFWSASVITGLGTLLKGALAASSGTLEVTLGPGALLPDLPYHSLPGILLDLLDAFSLWSLAVLTLAGAAMWQTTKGSAFAVTGAYWLLQALLVGGSRVFGSWMLGSL